MSNKHEPRYSTLENETQVSVVTGSSGGIGLETSVLLAENGFHTYASVRNLEKSKALIDTAENDVLPLRTIELLVAIHRLNISLTRSYMKRKGLIL